MKNNRQIGFATRAIHVGQEPDPLAGAVTVPIYPTSTYVQQGIGEHKGYEYSRVSNPTRTRLQENLAALEGGLAARVFASGMAAINAVTTLLKSGDHLICGNDLYGGVPRLFDQIWADFGLEFSYVDTSETGQVERSMRKNTRMVYVETPTNPLMRLSDIRAIAAICRRRKIALIVDNTFMSPYFQQPLALGADMVVHSTTKFLGGHGNSKGPLDDVGAKLTADEIRQWLTDAKSMTAKTKATRKPVAPRKLSLAAAMANSSPSSRHTHAMLLPPRTLSLKPSPRRCRTGPSTAVRPTPRPGSLP